MTSVEKNKKRTKYKEPEDYINSILRTTKTSIEKRKL
jgi:hypothetical protein